MSDVQFDLMECVRLDLEECARQGRLPPPDQMSRAENDRGLITLVDGDWRHVTWKWDQRRGFFIEGRIETRYLLPAKLT